MNNGQTAQNGGALDAEGWPTGVLLEITGRAGSAPPRVAPVVGAEPGRDGAGTRVACPRPGNEGVALGWGSSDEGLAAGGGDEEHMFSLPGGVR